MREWVSLAAERTNDVQRLYQNCTAGDDSRQLLCAGFISGVGNLMDLVGQIADLVRRDGHLKDEADANFASSLSICKKPSNGAMVQAFKNWARKHPEQWNNSQVIGVVTALQENFPCN